MHLKPGKRSAVKMCLKCIFGVKSAKKNFFNKNFRVGPLFKGRSGNRKHKIYSIRPYPNFKPSVIPLSQNFSLLSHYPKFPFQGPTIVHLRLTFSYVFRDFSHEKIVS